MTNEQYNTTCSEAPKGSKRSVHDSKTFLLDTCDKDAALCPATQAQGHHGGVCSTCTITLSKKDRVIHVLSCPYKWILGVVSAQYNGVL